MVAIRHGLFGQIGADRRLVDMKPKTFARRCSQYGVGEATDDHRPQGRRAVVLNPDFLAELISGPAPAAHPAECDRDAQDGRTPPETIPFPADDDRGMYASPEAEDEGPEDRAERDETREFGGG